MWDRQTDTQTHTHSGILFSHETEGNPAIYNNLVGAWGHYAKWNKSDRERQILYAPTYMWNLKMPNSEKHRVEWKLPGVGENGEMWVKGYKLSVIRLSSLGI